MKIKQKSTLQFHLHEQAESLRDKFIRAFPVIAFFLTMFYLVIYLFGMEHVMVVTLTTLLFQVNYKKHQTAGTLLRLIIQQLFLVILAYIATWDLLPGMILNLIVPFWLIFSKASPFNQLGYFSSLMTFTFMQLMHMEWHGFKEQFTAMVFCCTVFFRSSLYLLKGPPYTGRQRHRAEKHKTIGMYYGEKGKERIPS